MSIPVWRKVTANEWRKELGVIIFLLYIHYRLFIIHCVPFRHSFQRSLFIGPCRGLPQPRRRSLDVCRCRWSLLVFLFFRGRGYRRRAYGFQFGRRKPGAHYAASLRFVRALRPASARRVVFGGSAFGGSGRAMRGGNFWAGILLL